MQRRKDNKGRVLKDGEVYRKSDGLYMYRWTAKNGKRHTIYDATLEGLREKEEKIQHDLAEGIRIPECSLTLNDLFGKSIPSPITFICIIGSSGMRSA